MTMAIEQMTVMCELDRRCNDGMNVQLLWDPQTDRVSIALTDDHSGESLAFEVDPGEALTAFHHPYAYANSDRPLTHARRQRSQSARKSVR
jgi:hypothetical protein